MPRWAWASTSPRVGPVRLASSTALRLDHSPSTGLRSGAAGGPRHRTCAGGGLRPPVVAAGDTWRADKLRQRVPARAWQCVSAGRGAKGHRFYDWAFVQLDPGDHDPDDPGRRWLLVRRNRSSGELAYYHCWTPHPTPLATLIGVAGRRWSIEERIKTSKGLAGLDQHQVRGWRSWYRWATLAMLAHAFLVVAALTSNTRHPHPWT
jgi:SRSO17 transposase